MGMQAITFQLRAKIIEGDASLDQRRLATRDLLRSFSLSNEERALLKKFVLYVGALSIATADVVFEEN